MDVDERGEERLRAVIREARTQGKQKQAALAGELGVSPQIISTLEHGGHVSRRTAEVMLGNWRNKQAGSPNPVVRISAKARKDKGVPRGATGKPGATRASPIFRVVDKGLRRKGATKAGEPTVVTPSQAQTTAAGLLRDALEKASPFRMGTLVVKAAEAFPNARDGQRDWAAIARHVGVTPAFVRKLACEGAFELTGDAVFDFGVMSTTYAWLTGHFPMPADYVKDFMLVNGNVHNPKGWRYSWLNRPNGWKHKPAPLQVDEAELDAWFRHVRKMTDDQLFAFAARPPGPTLTLVPDPEPAPVEEPRPPQQEPEMTAVDQVRMVIPFVHADGERTFVTSREIANAFGKEHFNVLRDIKALECTAEFTQLNFEVSSYSDVSGKSNPEYRVYKDGFMFLVMGFTGALAARIKEAYIVEFGRKEEELRRLKSGGGSSKLEELLAQNLVALQGMVIEDRKRLQSVEAGTAEVKKDVDEVKALIAASRFDVDVHDERLDVEEAISSDSQLTKEQRAILGKAIEVRAWAIGSYKANGWIKAALKARYQAECAASDCRWYMTSQKHFDAALQDAKNYNPTASQQAWLEGRWTTDTGAKERADLHARAKEYARKNISVVDSPRTAEPPKEDK